MESATVSDALTALTQPLSATAAAGALAVIAIASFAVRVVLAREVHGPFVFMDELGYEQMARSLVRHGNLALLGNSGSTYSPLYSVVLAPIYALAPTAHSAYEWAKVLNAALMSLSVIPLYAIARFVVPRPKAIGAAALSLVAPLMFYSGLEMSENLAYPLFLLAIWAILGAVSDPRPRNDALLLGAIALAAAARIQLIVLAAVALTAIVLYAVLRGDAAGERTRSLWRSIREHRLLFGVTGAAAIVVLVKTMINGGSLPIAGRYANAGSAHANPLRVLELAVQHLAELDFAVGVIPFACALLAAYALVKFGFPRRALAFGAVAVATSFWLLLEVAFDAAAYDHPGDPYGTPRIHERYLIYLVPLILVAMVAGLQAIRPRVTSRAHLAIAAVALLLPAAIPFGRVINYTIPVDTFGLQIFGAVVHGDLQAIAHARLIAVCIAGFFTLGYLYALLRPRPSFAIVMTVVAFLMLSILVRVRIDNAAATSTALEPAHPGWVDAAAPNSDVILISGRSQHGHALEGTAQLLYAAFENLDISRVYYTCAPVFGADFGERELSVAADGALRDGANALRARYVVAPRSLHIRGRIVAAPSRGGLELVAPAERTVAVGGRTRSPGCSG